METFTVARKDVLTNIAGLSLDTITCAICDNIVTTSSSICTECHEQHELEATKALTNAAIDPTVTTEAVCIRFCGLSLDVWLDAESIAEAGSVYAWAEGLGLEGAALSHITMHDYEVVDLDAEMAQLAYSGGHWGTIDWSALNEYLESHLDKEVIAAAVALGFSLEEAEDKYLGTYESDEEMAEQYAEETGMLESVPENLRGYIDFAAMGRDFATELSQHNGVYFHG